MCLRAETAATSAVGQSPVKQAKSINIKGHVNVRGPSLANQLTAVYMGMNTCHMCAEYQSLTSAVGNRKYVQ